jgi:acyl-coenzyme A synthetase/AMP-(fatty) acid ligase
MGPDDRILHAGAFNWTYTLGVGLTDPWANGASTILYNGQKDPGVWLGIMARFRATLFAAVPTLYRQILKYDDPSAHDLSAFRHGLTAGEALPPALAEAWRARTGTPLYEALGMSECSTYVSSAPAVPPRPGSPGKPQPGRAVAILDPAGGETPISRGETGLLAVHRTDPGLMLGYWNRPDEEAEVFRGAWFVGGDLAAMDADGYIHFKGRNDDLMNAFGYRVSPMEVEAALADHPDLAEVAVTTTRPRPDVEVVTAFAVPREGTAPDEALRESVLEAARRRLAGYKVPRAVVFVDALPRTPNGKVLRRALRDGGNGA